MDNNNKKSLSEAIGIIADALRRENDKGIYAIWKNAISGAFKNRVRNLSNKQALVFVIRKDQLGEISDAAANLFLKQLIELGAELGNQKVNTTTAQSQPPQSFIRKKILPDEVEAIQWNGSNEKDISSFLNGGFVTVEKPHPIFTIGHTFGDKDYKLSFPHTSGIAVVTRGQWILRCPVPQTIPQSYTFDIRSNEDFIKEYRPASLGKK